MTKELERAGIPSVIITTLTTVAQNIGATRIVRGVGIPYVTGDPFNTPDGERARRTRIVETALKALETPVEGQRVFEA